MEKMVTKFDAFVIGFKNRCMEAARILMPLGITTMLIYLVFNIDFIVDIVDELYYISEAYEWIAITAILIGCYKLACKATDKLLA